MVRCPVRFHRLAWLAIWGLLGCTSGNKNVPLAPVDKASGAALQRPNVLFIAIDDLRPEWQTFGHTQAKAPRLARFARQAATFHRHYVQVPTCGASRYSLLTGRRPQQDIELTNDPWPLLGPNRDEAQSFPQLFRTAGYRTVSIGKVTHSPSGRMGERGDGPPQLPKAWDETYVPLGQYEHAWALMHGYAGGVARAPGTSPATESADVDDSGYADGLIAQEAVAKLQTLSRGRTPFVLAVGFLKPHLPFACPRKYWDLYSRKEIELTKYSQPPRGVDASMSLHRMDELRGNYAGLGAVESDEARRLRHGYLACISYVDAQVGKLLDALDKLGLRDNTIVVVWGDHGWHLGDLAVWGKHTLFEWSLRSPLLIRGPSIRPHDHHGLVESIDIYPTLAALAGLQVPATVMGRSFLPLLRDPRLGGKSEAFGYWKKPGGVKATTIRTDRHRLIQWLRNGKVVQTELYDHLHDPGETTNVAAGAPEVVFDLLARLQAQDPRYAFDNGAK